MCEPIEVKDDRLSFLGSGCFGSSGSFELAVMESFFEPRELLPAEDHSSLVSRCGEMPLESMIFDRAPRQARERCCPSEC